MTEEEQCECAGKLLELASNIGISRGLPTETRLKREVERLERETEPDKYTPSYHSVIKGTNCSLQLGTEGLNWLKENLEKQDYDRVREALYSSANSIYLRLAQQVPSLCEKLIEKPRRCD